MNASKQAYMTKRPRLTVAVCTCNRFEHLPECLATLEQQDLPKQDYEVLVVDNSDDHAASAAFWANFAADANCRVVKSPKRGLSRARNIALDEAAAPRIAFVDDDARAAPGWAAALLDGFERADPPAVVFGPIHPIWPDGVRPEWIGASFERALTILYLGDDSRVAGENEYGYGANIAFEVAAARAAGGFLEHLGRDGRSLVSGEETRLQQDIRRQGRKIRYQAGAVVHHYVHEDRMTRSWLMARFAWQGATDRIENVKWASPDQALQRLACGSYAPEVSEFFRRLFRDEPPDYRRLPEQLKVVRDLVTLLLSLNDIDDARLSHIGSDASDNLTDSAPVSDAPYRWAPPIAPGTRLLVVEGARNMGHSYLIPPLRRLPHMQELEIELVPDTPYDGYRGLLEAAEGRDCTLFFPTLDKQLYWANRARFTAALEHRKVRLAGILHRFPDNALDEAAFRRFAPRLQAIFVLAPQMQDALRDRYGLDNIHWMPHPAQHAPHLGVSRADARRQLGIPNGTVVLAQMGEQRPGKGLERLLEALPLLSEAARARLFFLFAGKAPSETIDRARGVLETSGIAHLLDLRDNKRRGDYVVLSEAEFGLRLCAADFGLLLFDGPQKDVMSGALSDFLVAGAGIVATRDSAVGALVERLGAGAVLTADSPAKLACELDKIAAAPPRPDTGPLAHYREEISEDRIAARIAEKLGLAGALSAPIAMPARRNA